MSFNGMCLRVRGRRRDVLLPMVRRRLIKASYLHSFDGPLFYVRGPAELHVLCQSGDSLARVKAADALGQSL